MTSWISRHPILCWRATALSVTASTLICNTTYALEDIWDYSYHSVPYYGTNTPMDECYKCGFTDKFAYTSKGFTCPKCSNHNLSHVSVTRQVCGYLGSPDARPFNVGKQEEVKQRIKHLSTGELR